SDDRHPADEGTQRVERRGEWDGELEHASDRDECGVEGGDRSGRSCYPQSEQAHAGEARQRGLDPRHRALPLYPRGSTSTRTWYLVPTARSSSSTRLTDRLGVPIGTIVTTGSLEANACWSPRSSDVEIAKPFV